MSRLCNFLLLMKWDPQKQEFKVRQRPEFQWQPFAALFSVLIPEIKQKPPKMARVVLHILYLRIYLFGFLSLERDIIRLKS